MARTNDTFEQIVAEAFERLPAWVRKKVKNVALLVEDVVDEKTAKKMRLRSPMHLMGLYHGVPRIARHNDAPFSLPDVITLYRLPLEARARYEGVPLEEVVYETLWHEIGHHFGFSEKGIRKREREQFSRKRKR